ncbi:MAG: PP2C family protein-serine/threonine phosphatase [Chitinophagales bacterium]
MAISIQHPVFLHEKGRRRNNEDSILPIDDSATSQDRLFIVCDGVGGANKGEIASRMVCDIFQVYFNESPTDFVDAKYLNDGLKFVEQKLTEHIEEHPECRGMATTLTVVYFDDKNNRVVVGWCGDSRIYQIRNGKIKFISEDHSLVNELVKRGEITAEEALVHPQRNVILRAISGQKSPTKIDVVELTDIQKNDYFLLCSDGILESIDNRVLLTLLKDEKCDIAQVNQQIKELCAQYSNDNFSMYLLKVSKVTKLLMESKATKILPIVPEKAIDVTEKRPSDKLDESNKRVLYLAVIAAILALLTIFGYNLTQKNAHNNRLMAQQETCNQKETEIRDFLKSDNKSDAISLYRKAVKECDSLANNTIFAAQIKNIEAALHIENLENSMKDDASKMLLGNEDSLKKYEVTTVLLDSLIEQSLKSDVDSLKEVAQEEFSRLRDILKTETIKQPIAKEPDSQTTSDDSVKINK